MEIMKAFLIRICLPFETYIAVSQVRIAIFEEADKVFGQVPNKKRQHQEFCLLP